MTKSFEFFSYLNLKISKYLNFYVSNWFLSFRLGSFQPVFSWNCQWTSATSPSISLRYLTTATTVSKYQALSHSLHFQNYSSHEPSVCLSMRALNVCIRRRGGVVWMNSTAAVCLCVRADSHLGGCELTNQQAVTVDLLWAAWCLQAAQSEFAHSQPASLFFLYVSFSVLALLPPIIFFSLCSFNPCPEWPAHFRPFSCLRRADAKHKGSSSHCQSWCPYPSDRRPWDSSLFAGCDRPHQISHTPQPHISTCWAFSLLLFPFVLEL